MHVTDLAGLLRACNLRPSYSLGAVAVVHASPGDVILELTAGDDEVLVHHGEERDIATAIEAHEQRCGKRAKLVVVVR